MENFIFCAVKAVLTREKNEIISSSFDKRTALTREKIKIMLL